MASELAQGVLRADVDGLPIAVVERGGALFAFEDRCTHDDYSLTEEIVEIEDGSGRDGAPVIVCPHHGARFCLRDGAVLSPPAYEPLRIFPVRRNSARVEVRVD